MSRQFVFRNYWWIALLGAVLGLVLVVKFARVPRGTLVGSVIAAALGFCYFVQQQKLAEMRLFRELFTGFNERYDKLSRCLREIVARGRARDEADAQTIIDYFNLCGEEYLFFSEGYIHREAWRSWCAGRLCYFEHEPFRSQWDGEKATNSYYGLSLEAIRRGAA
jgi:hypothetical protein